MANFFVIFGAAVRHDGAPSGTLRRRVEGALATAAAAGAGTFIASGARGRHGDAEAVVMERLLIAAGIERHAIIRDEASRDTLQSVLNCGHILRQRVGHGDTVFVCTSRYHMPRCVWLFRMSGCVVRAGRMVADRPSMKRSSLTYLYGREVPATAWDTVVMAARRVTGRMSGAVGRSA